MATIQLNRFRVSVVSAALAGLMSLAGCGRISEDTPPLNQTLGSGVIGAPVGGQAADLGILKDQTAYRPTKYQPLAQLAGVAPSGAAAQDDSPQAAEVRALMDDFLTGIYSLDFGLVLDCFPPDRVKALDQDDYRSAMIEMSDTLKNFWSVFKSKAEGTDLAPVVKLVELLPQTKGPTLASLTVKTLDEENANVTVDKARFEAAAADISSEMQAAVAEVTPVIMSAVAGAMAAQQPGGAGQEAAPAMTPEMMQQMMGGMGGAPGAAPMAVEDLPVVKIEGAWKIALPMEISEDLAEFIHEGCLLTKDYFGELTARIDAAPEMNAQSFMAIAMQVGMAKAPQAMAWQARAMTLFGGMTGSQPSPDDDPGAEAPSGSPRSPREAGGEDEP